MVGKESHHLTRNKKKLLGTGENLWPNQREDNVKWCRIYDVKQKDVKHIQPIKKWLTHWEMCRDEKLQNVNVAGMHKKRWITGQKTCSWAWIKKCRERSIIMEKREDNASMDRIHPGTLLWQQREEIYT